MHGAAAPHAGSTHPGHAPAAIAEPRAPAPAPVVSDAVPLDRGALEEVALRMERIKASAAAIRQAIEHEAERAAIGPSTASAPTGGSLTMPASAPVAPPRAAVLTAVPDDDDDAPPVVRAPPRQASTSGSFEARAEPPVVADLERNFLGGDDDYNEAPTEDLAEQSGVDAFAAFAPASRPIPWKPILIAAGVLTVVGAWMLRDQLLPSQSVTQEATAADVRPGSVAPGKAEATPPTSKPSPVAAGTPPAAQKAPDAGPPIGTPASPAGSPTATPATSPGAPTAAGGAPPSSPAQTPPPTATTAGGVSGSSVPAGPSPTASSRPGAPVDPGTVAQVDEARTLYTAAKGGSRKRKLDEARGILQELLGRNGNNADALLLLAQIDLEQGRPDTALENASKCTQVAADQADCWLTIGVLQQDRNKKADAVAAYEKYLALAPDGRYAGDVRKQLSRIKK